MIMGYGYQYTHSNLGADGTEYITFMTRPEILDDRGMRNGPAISIDIDHIHQKTEVFRFRWVHGAPRGFDRVCTLKNEIIVDSEVPELMKRLGIEVKGGDMNG